MIARMHYNALRFYKSDGADRSILESCLTVGELTETAEYFQLSQTKRGLFNIILLNLAVSEVYLQSGVIASRREREVCLKYFSQVGLFEHGELAGVRR